MHDIDPCYENGEFHTLVYSGSNFKAAIKYQFDLDNSLINNEFYVCVTKLPEEEVEKGFDKTYHHK